MHLKEVEITNFRCFEHLKMDFDPRMTVIVGANGAGKTALLEEIAAALPGRTYVVGAQDISRFARKSAVGSETEADFMINLTFVDVDSNELTETLQSRNHTDKIGTYLRHTPEPHVWEYWHIQRGGRIFHDGAPFEVQQWFQSQEQEYMAQMQEWDALPDSPTLESKPKRAKAVEEVIQILSTFIPVLLSVHYSFRTNTVNLNFKRAEERVATVPFQLLSSGYRVLAAMVMSLGMRAATLPKGTTSDGATKLQGTILIDEIDLHLHPAWQRTVLQVLLNAFPKMQFIVTTHSPQIVASAQAEWVRILDRDGSVTKPTDQTYGADSNRILQEIFGVPSRPSEIVEKINAAGKLLELKQYDDALQAILDLQKEIGPHDTAVNGLLWELNFAGAADAEDHQE